MAQTDESTGARVLRGAVAGLVAGVAASFTMDRFQAAVGGLLPSSGGDSEPSTSKAADRVSKAVTGRTVPKSDQALAGQTVHYLLGALLGAVYGVAAEFRPEVTAGGGAAFGAAACAIVDEGVVPAAGLAAPFWKAPLWSHGYSLASHLIYGATAEFVRRQVDSTLKPE